MCWCRSALWETARRLYSFSTLVRKNWTGDPENPDPCPWSIPKNDKLRSYQATLVYTFSIGPDQIHPHFWSPWWCSQGCAHLNPRSRWRNLGEYFRWIGTKDLNGPSLSVACLFLLTSFQTWGWLECAVPAMSSTNISAIGYVSGAKRAHRFNGSLWGFFASLVLGTRSTHALTRTTPQTRGR